MGFRIHNSLSDTKEEFKPATPGVVKLYNCGPTVYSYNHIGNFRSYMAVDILRRTLQFLGYKVDQTTNITDVEDKIIANAAKEKKTIYDFTAPYIKYFLEDLSSIRVQDVEHRPKATDSIAKMVEIIAALEKGGFTYTLDGNVYFRLKSYDDYGKLSGIDAEQLKAAAGGRFTADEYTKEDIRDFALWKKVEPNEEPGWDSPWGRGRPGWHLECSAMIRDIYGAGGIDIHAGGIDLVFPHHENEMAQSCCAYRNDNFVRYWVHNEHLLVDGKKMSKSLGNYFTLRDFTDKERLNALVESGKAPADTLKLLEKGVMDRALRHLLLSTHYRSRLNFTFENLKGSDSACDRIQSCVDRLLAESKETKTTLGKAYDARNRETPESLFKDKALFDAMADFRSSLEDDLNISRALAAIFDAVTSLNVQKLTPDLAREGLLFFYSVNQVLDLIDFTQPDQREVKKESLGDIESYVLGKIKDRNDARAAKNWKLSDEIRDELKEKGIILKDSATGTTWEKQ